MSNETLTWLNTQTLIGQTAQRGHAWHYRAEEQGDETNHYPGAIPVEDVKRRLFSWQAVPRRVAVELPADAETMTHLGENGEPLRWAVQEDKQAIARSDDGTVFPRIFGQGYRPHQYGEWLLDNVATILDDDLQISSAGLLKEGAVAWVEVSVPDSITTPEGVTFRPNLLALTSFDGSLATTYKRTIQLVVCDNTLAMAHAENGETVRVKHSAHSLRRITDVRAALSIVHATSAEFEREVEALVAQVVTDDQYWEIVSHLVPIDVEQDGRRKQANAEQKRDELFATWATDPRVAPWTGTAFGVLQTVNTWAHHVQGDLDDAARAQRNQLRAVDGTLDKLAAEVREALATVLA